MYLFVIFVREIVTKLYNKYRYQCVYNDKLDCKNEVHDNGLGKTCICYHIIINSTT